MTYRPSFATISLFVSKGASACFTPSTSTSENRQTPSSRVSSFARVFVVRSQEDNKSQHQIETPCHSTPPRFARNSYFQESPVFRIKSIESFFNLRSIARGDGREPQGGIWIRVRLRVRVDQIRIALKRKTWIWCAPILILLVIVLVLLFTSLSFARATRQSQWVKALIGIPFGRLLDAYNVTLGILNLDEPADRGNLDTSAGRPCRRWP